MRTRFVAEVIAELPAQGIIIVTGTPVVVGGGETT